MKTRKSMSTAMRSAVSALLIVCIVTVAVAAQQPGPVLGKTNLQGWIDEAPGLPNSLDEAEARKNGNTNGRSIYQAFYDRVEAFKKAYKDALAGRAKPDETAMRNAAAAQVDSNLARVNSLPVIAQMGGIDKLAQMTPEQRAQVAGQMAQSMEKEAKLRKFLGGSIAGLQAAQQMQGDQRQANQRPQAGSEAATIQRDLELMLQQRSALDTAFTTRDAEIANSKGSHRDINQDAAAILATIPMVNDAIMGRVHDLEQEAALNKETAARHRERANWELRQRTVLFTDQKLKLKELASGYQNWLKNNQDKINTSTAPGDLLRGANTEIAVAEYEESFIDAANDLAKYSEAVTRDVASYQEMYQQGNGAIRVVKKR